MNTGRITVLVLVTLVFTACGPSRGLRLERATPSADIVGADTKIGTTHVVSVTVVNGPPGPLASDGRQIWVSAPAFGTVSVQAIASRPGTAGGVISMPYRGYLPAAIATTRGTMWILVKPSQGHSQLLHIHTRQDPVRSVAPIFGRIVAPRDLRRQALAFPRDTRLMGATRSALWLVSHTARGYSLWRRDLQTSKLSRFALASNGSPGVAVTSEQVFVVLQTRPPSTVVIQTRDLRGRITATSSPLRIDRTFQPAPLGACQDQIFGWARDSRGATLFRVAATGARPKYTETLPPLENPSKLRAMAFGNHCRDIWVATVSHSSGAVSRLSTSSLTVTGQINTSYIRALLWAHGSLWASDLEHNAVLRIR
jgi:hypothetical protein